MAVNSVSTHTHTAVFVGADTDTMNHSKQLLVQTFMRLPCSMEILAEIRERIALLESHNHKECVVAEATRSSRKRICRQSVTGDLKPVLVQEGGRFKPQNAAACVFEQAELLELILRHLDVPALRLLKPVNQSVANVARRLLLAPSWLQLNDFGNLRHIRRVFASKRAFKLPLRVALEHFCCRTGIWTHKFGTLLRLKVKRRKTANGPYIWPTEILLEIDGEGLHETMDCIGLLGRFTRLQAWDFSHETASIVEEQHDGLGLVRPVLAELVKSCGALCQPPVVGPSLAELILAGQSLE